MAAKKNVKPRKALPSSAMPAPINIRRPAPKPVQSEPVTDASVTSVPVDAAKIITFGSNHPIWVHEPASGFPKDLEKIRGAFVRLQGPPNAVQGHEASLKQVLLAEGALGVKVLPRPKGSLPKAASVQMAARKARNAREVVEEMLGEATAVDAKTLCEVVEGVLSGVGL